MSSSIGTPAIQDGEDVSKIRATPDGGTYARGGLALALRRVATGQVFPFRESLLAEVGQDFKG